MDFEKRERKNYLTATLDNVFANIDNNGTGDTLVIVFIGEANYTTALSLATEIKVILHGLLSELKIFSISIIF